MPNWMRRVFALLVILWVVVSARAGAQGQIDEQQIAATIARFFDAYGQHNVEAAMSEWGPSAPELIRARVGFRRVFGSNRITIRNIGVPRITLKGDHARALVEAEIEAADKVTGLAPEGFGHIRKLFELVKTQGGVWQISSFEPAENTLAQELITAKSEGERHAILLRETTLADSELVRMLTRLARHARRHDNGPEPVRVARIAIEVADQIKDDTAKAWAEIGLGDLLDDQSQFEEATKHAGDANSTFVRMGLRRGQAAVLNLFGQIDAAQSKFKTAKANFEKARNLALGVDREIEAEALLGLSYALNGDGKPDESLKALDEYRDLATAMDDPDKLATEKLNRGMILLKQRKEVERAERLLNEASDDLAAVGDLEGQLEAKNDLAVSYEERGGELQLAKAERTYLEVLAQEEKLHFDHSRCGTLLNLGNVQKERGLKDKALEYYEKARDLAHRIHDQEDETGAIGNAGTVYQSSGLYERALEKFQEARIIDHARATGKDDQQKTTSAEALDVANIAAVYGATARWDLAIRSFREALVLFKATNMQAEIGETESNIGELEGSLHLLKQGIIDMRGALRYLPEENTPDLRASTFAGLADLERQAGNREATEKDVTEAIRIAKAMNRADLESLARLVEGTLYQKSAPEKSAAAFTEALHLGDVSGSVEVSIQARTGLGEIALAKRDWPEAKHQCGSAVEDVEALTMDSRDPITRAGILDVHADAYVCLVRALAGAGEIGEAFRTAERSKVRAVRDIVGAGQFADSYLTDEERSRLSQSQDQINILNNDILANPAPEAIRRLRDASDALRKLRTETYASHPDTAARFAIGEPLGPEDADWLLTDEKSVLLEYVFGSESSLLFVLRRSAGSTKAEPAIVDLPITRDQLRVLTDGVVRRMLEAGNALANLLDTSAYKVPQLETLYTKLVEPAAKAKLLDGVNHLVVIGDDGLWRTPMAAFVGPNGRFLVEDFSISYAVSLTALKAMTALAAERSQAPRLPMLLVGNPYLGPNGKATIPPIGEFVDLPDAKKQIDLIQAGAEKRRLQTIRLVGKKASMSAVVDAMQGAGIVHFAAHGYFNPVDPLESGLILSREHVSKYEDGILHGRDILHLPPMNARLAVLSACSSGRGQVFGGSGTGPVGLAYSLFVAGVPSTITALWNVNSASAPQLFDRFYDLWGYGIDPRAKDMAAALQVAQKAEIHRGDRFAHPYFWAPFVVAGSGK